MKLVVTLNGDKREVELRQTEIGWEATVDGRQYELRTAEPEPGVFLFKIGGRVAEAAVTATVIKDEYRVRFAGNEFSAIVADPKRLRSGGGTEGDASGRVELRTAMPGKVVRVLVTEGASVEKGDGIVVVEAMKMQNELKAAKAGTVAEIRAAEGDTVAAGDILAVID